MFDIGWPELLVVAIVLIIVVGPKDLPPMLRAFGRTTKKLRSMASEFRGQFDEALREADLDDVKKTFDSARKLNPMQSIRDAVNPLKDTAKEIRSDLEKSVKTPSTAADKPVPDVAVPTPAMKLADGPPEIKADAPAPTGKAGDKTTSKSVSPSGAAAKAKTSARAKTPAKPAVKTELAAKPTTKSQPVVKPVARKTAAKASAASKPSSSDAPAATIKAAAKPSGGAKAPARARKPKQGEGSA
jgi:sec-independent protein translocase protein TatB